MANSSHNNSITFLPSCKLSSSWVQNALVPQHLQKQREHAYQQYSAQEKYISNKELARVITAAIPYEQYMLEHYTQASYKDLGQGACISEVAPAYKKNAHIQQLITHNSSALAQLVAATYTYAQVLYVPAHVFIKEPITLESCIEEQRMRVELLIVIIEAGAQVTIHDYQQLTHALLMRSTLIYIEHDAQLVYSLKQDYTGHVYSVQDQLWSVGARTQATSMHTSSGGTLSVMTQEYNLADEHACIDYKYSGIIKEQEQQVLGVKQHHKAAFSKSSVEAKVVLYDNSRCFYRGDITIDKTGQKSQAQQQHSALILSDNAKNCAIPALQVKAHDVQCRHGSASGYIDEQQLWYLQSRGLDYNQGMALIVDAFLSLR